MKCLNGTSCRVAVWMAVLLTFIPASLYGAIITEFSTGITPWWITAGPDGNLWFTEQSGNRIGRITPAGVVTTFSAGISSNADLFGITAGLDGNLWFTEQSGNRIGRITPAGVVTEFSAGISSAAYPLGITAGPDGNLWFTEGGWGDRIGRITPAGVVTEFFTGISSRVYGITAGPDGNLWFTESNGNWIGRITLAGVVTEFGASGHPLGITAGPDGNLWFTESNGNRIGRITPAGVVTEFSTGISSAAYPSGITAGPDGNLWFTESDGNRIGRITPAGLVTEFSSGIRSNARPWWITAGPDGNLWFTESGDTWIGRLALSGPAPVGSYILPSSSYRMGANAAEYRTDVRILNQGTSAVTVTATFYDQVTSTTLPASPFQIDARNQASFDNILQSLFGKTLSQGAYGPIRFDATGPILVASNVNNVNACGMGAVSGQWLPGIAASQALKAGVIGQLAVSASTTSGYRTNLVFMNPGNAAATATVKVRQGGGALLSTGTIGPLPANGFSQVALDSTLFPGVAGTTDTDLWLEFTSDQPMLAYATMINNASGDPFAVVASSDTPPNPFSGNYSGTYAGSENGTWTASVNGDGTMTLNIVSPSAGPFSGSGDVSQSGDVNATTGSVSGLGTLTFTGKLHLQGSGATGSGTWASSSGYSGTWSGTKT
jgi:streptogramin lyase